MREARNLLFGQTPQIGCLDLDQILSSGLSNAHHYSDLLFPVRTVDGLFCGGVHACLFRQLQNARLLDAFCTSSFVRNAHNGGQDEVASE
jgi:hypothetical protein